MCMVVSCLGWNALLRELRRVIRTGRADIVQNLVGADLRIDCLDRGGHFAKYQKETRKRGREWEKRACAETDR